LTLSQELHLVSQLHQWDFPKSHNFYNTRLLRTQFLNPTRVFSNHTIYTNEHKLEALSNFTQQYKKDSNMKQLYLNFGAKTNRFWKTQKNYSPQQNDPRTFKIFSKNQMHDSKVFFLTKSSSFSLSNLKTMNSI